MKKKVTSDLKYPTILLEDNHLLIVNKPSGLLVQGDQSGDWTLKDWAEKDVAKRFNKPGKAFIGLPHRLDRPSSGIVILAKTSKSLTSSSPRNLRFFEVYPQKTSISQTSIILKI